MRLNKTQTHTVHDGTCPPDAEEIFLCWYVCKMYNEMGVFTMVYDCFQYKLKKVIYY